MLKKKQIFTNPNEEWLKYNFIATTSTTEAGVNFDPEDKKGNKIKHFHKICATLGKGCSQRQMNQGLLRVRNPIDNNNIYIHNKCFKYAMIYNFTTFNQIKDNDKYKELDFIYKNVDFYKHYIINCIFNDVEKRNKEKNFIEYFELFVREKGGEFIYIKKKDNEKRFVKSENYKTQNMINANFIENAEQLEKLIKKQEMNKATEQEKYDIRKTLFMRNTCHLMYHEIIQIEEAHAKIKKEEKQDIPQIYNKFIKATKEIKNENIIENFLYLVDDDNNKKWTENQLKLNLFDVSIKYKKEVIVELLDLFKIKNFTEENELVNFKETLIKNYSKMKLFTNKDVYKYDYDIFKTDEDIKNMKKIMGCN